MNHTIFYFTGTGNSLKNAQILAAKESDTTLVSMAKKLDRAGVEAPVGLVGFVFPVYFCGRPQRVATAAVSPKPKGGYLHYQPFLRVWCWISGSGSLCRHRRPLG